MKTIHIYLIWLVGLLTGVPTQLQAQSSWDPESPPEPGQLSVTLVSTPAGCANFSQSNANGRYEKGSAVEINVMPYNDYDFVAWVDEQGTTVSTEPAYRFTVEKNRRLTASLAFNPKENPAEPGNGFYKLITTSSPGNGGLVNQYVGEENGYGLYESGQSVKLKAIPYPDYAFSHWERNGETIGEQEELLFTMPNRHAYVTAVFTWNPESPAEPGQSVGWLYVKRNLNEAGNVTQSGNGVYAIGATVRLVASPAFGYRFLGWYEGSQLLSDRIQFDYTISKNRCTLEARFAQVTTPGNPDTPGPTPDPDPGTPVVPDYPEIPVQVDPSTSDQGSVQVEGVMRPGQKVTITAIPEEGYAFEGWYINGVLIEDAEMAYQFIVEHDVESITVKFREIPFQLDNNQQEAGLVKVTKLRGNTAHLSAGPKKGHYFYGWFLSGKLLSKEKEYDFDIRQLPSLRASNLPVIEAVYLEGTDGITAIQPEEWVSLERQPQQIRITVHRAVRSLTLYDYAGHCLQRQQRIAAGSSLLWEVPPTPCLLRIETERGVTVVRR
ncbi:MAG: InlB B-repeat-containing protein [Parabacteroides sp.]